MKSTTSLGGLLAGLTFAGVGLASLPVFSSWPAMAQAQRQPALTGKVSSQEEGAMEGVMVSAKRKGSTIMVSVASNGQGQFSFPSDRLEPGVYDITMRAAGYVLAPTTATIAAGAPAQIDLKLTKASKDELAQQLSNAEWILSAPGTPAQKISLLRCFDCHGLQRPIFSHKNAEEMALVVQRMGAHTANASPNFPFFQYDASEKLAAPPSKGEQDVGAYIASINLNGRDTWSYPLKTLARPKGKATQVIITTYDLPDLAAPHDTLRDKEGNVWFSDFQHQFISRLDPKTGKVTRYPVPVSKPGFPTGGLMITQDKDGNIWEGMMGQAQIAKVNPKTGEVSILLAPEWDKGDTRFTMIDALHSDVDGKLWTKTNGGPDPQHANKLYQVELATGKFTEILPPAGKRDIAAYGLVTDLENNVYGLDNSAAQKQIWKTNAKTGETKYIDVTDGGGRRGHIDSQNRLWFSQFYANRYGMYDPKTEKVTLWELPTSYAGAYDVQFDDTKYVWGADMSTDLVQRMDLDTGEWTSYLLPISINTRHVDVQKATEPGGLSSMWTEGQQNGKIVHIEPLTP